MRPVTSQIYTSRCALQQRRTGSPDRPRKMSHVELQFFVLFPQILGAIQGPVTP